MTLSHYFSLVDVQARMALKADASRYFLGYLWWILEPLLFVAIFYLVFDIILDSGRSDFLIFLICGKLPFMWFSKSVTHASMSIVANAGLIGRIDAPKSVFPLAVIQEGLYKQIAVFALLLLALTLTGYGPDKHWLWLIAIIGVNYLLIVGCSFIGAMLVCITRDFAMLITLGMTFLLFTSGIFWDVRGLGSDESTQLVLLYNPLAFMVDAYRQVLMEHTSPNVIHLAGIGLGSLTLVVVTSLTLRRASRWLALRALTA